MFPVKDENPQINVPYVTYGLIALNVLVWVFVQGLGSEEALMSSICDFGIMPGNITGAEGVVGDPTMCPLKQQADWFTFLSSMFMHGGWMHIIGNMWFLWIFGDNVEDSMGPGRYLVFYVLSGIAAAAAQVFMDVGSFIPMVGASGAIGGVMGAYIVLYPRVHVHLFIIIFFRSIAVPAILMLGYWVLMQFWGVYSSMGDAGGGTAFWAHIGGFVAGAALVLVFKNEKLLADHPYRGWNQKDHKGSVWKRAV